MFRFKAISSLIVVALLSVSCDEPPGSPPPLGNKDYYGLLKIACDFRIPDALILKQEDVIHRYISVFDRHAKGAECLQEFEKHLHRKFTESWLDLEPETRKEHKKIIYEALQVLLAYPMKFPETGMLFQSFELPAGFLASLSSENGQLSNEKIINYILNRIDYFSYDAERKSQATYNHKWKTLIFTPVYFNAGALDRIVTLLHEARHYEKIHVKCRKNRFFYDKEPLRGRHCDDELDDPIGWSIALFDALVHGNFALESSSRYIDPLVLESYASHVCFQLHNYFREESFPEMIEFIDESLGNQICEGAGLQKWMEWEGMLMPQGIKEEIMKNQHLINLTQERLHFECDDFQE